MMKLNERFKVERKKKQMTQSEVAEELGMDDSMVSKVESGRAGVTTKTLNKFLEFYGLKQITTIDAAEELSEVLDSAGANIEINRSFHKFTVITNGAELDLKDWILSILNTP